VIEEVLPRDLIGFGKVVNLLVSAQAAVNALFNNLTAPCNHRPNLTCAFTIGKLLIVDETVLLQNMPDQFDFETYKPEGLSIPFQLTFSQFLTVHRLRSVDISRMPKMNLVHFLGVLE
jgi:hypothetical protein